MNQQVYIYTMSDPETRIVRYVGKASDIMRRWRQHKKEVGNTRKCNWIKSLALRGLEPTIEILETFPAFPESEWQEAERFWIISLRFMGLDLVNLDIGGIGGGSKSPETCRKISATKRANPEPMTQERRERLSLMAKNQSPEIRKQIADKLRGRKAPESVREKLRAAKVGWKQSPEAIAKSAITRTGKKRTPEQCARIAEAHKGIKPSPESIEKRRQKMIGRKKSEAEKLAMSKRMTGVKHSPETLEKLRVLAKIRWADGTFANRPYVNPWPTRRANALKALQSN